MSRIVAIVQARTGSTRLPAKVLLELLGQPILFHDFERIRRAKQVDDIVIATTSLEQDDRIEALCRSEGWNCYRGSSDDVLDRYYNAACSFSADVIIRITSDCPLIDPEIIDRVVEKFLDGKGKTDYSSNIHPERTYPRGLDTEVFSFAALEKSHRNEKRADLREHVTQYIVRHPDIFTITGIQHSSDLSGLRWTVDTPEDFAFVQEVYEYFGHNRFMFRDVLDLLEMRPELSRINSGIHQKDLVQ